MWFTLFFMETHVVHHDYNTGVVEVLFQRVKFLMSNSTSCFNTPKNVYL